MNRMFLLSLLTLVAVTSIPCVSAIACSPSTFICHSGYHCINQSWVCDGFADCRDGSDESDCNFPRNCSSNEFHCENNRCVPLKFRCDGENDCDDMSDEKNCPKSCDPLSEFTCSNGRCIPSTWKCDGNDDCGDDSDENRQICPEMPCQDNHFRCHNGYHCIAKTWVCDGENDCGDNSDEKQNCPVSKKCVSSEFSCKSGRECVPIKWKCDGTSDCSDGSDEVDCPEMPHKQNNSRVDCGESEWRCLDGSCIHNNWRCDGQNDCNDKSDEQACPVTNKDQVNCGPHTWKCSNSSNCISMTKRCDGHYDCNAFNSNDHSDELFCPDKGRITISPGSNQMCDKYHFKCKSSNVCIKLSTVCDGVNDCDDWSDEPTECNKDECSSPKTNNCTHICVDQPIGYQCKCRNGLKLSSDGFSCEDYDECKETFGICSGHKCTNTKKHFKCECNDGYTLKNHQFCKIKSGDADARLLFSHVSDIRSISIHPKVGHSNYDDIFSGLKGAIAIDYNLNHNYVVWSDIRENVLAIGKLNTSNDSPLHKSDEPNILVANVGFVNDLAIDWVHDLIYWTDEKTKTISVVSGLSPQNKVILVQDLIEPRGITLYPSESLIFWTDWGSSPKIERMNQDGTDRNSIVDTDILWPNDVTVDHITRRIFWLDVKKRSIETVDFDGHDRRTVIESSHHLHHPFSITLFEDYVYFSDWDRKAILRTNKFGGQEDSKVELVTGSFVRSQPVMGIQVVHPMNQVSSKNRCESAKCSHLCLPSGKSSFSCLCPHNFRLTSDGVTCHQVAEADESRPKPVVLIPQDPKSRLEHAINSVQERLAERDDEGITGMLIFSGMFVIFVSAIGLVAIICYRQFNRKTITALNFDNPVYRKTTEDQFSLEKSESDCGVYDCDDTSYPSSLEPLNSPGTNGFI